MQIFKYLQHTADAKFSALLKDKIIVYLKLIFHAERPPPPQIVQQQFLMAAEEQEEYF